MIKVNNDELMNIKGGSVSYTATFISALVRAIDIIFEIGKSLGSSIRRSSDNTSCLVK